MQGIILGAEKLPLIQNVRLDNLHVNFFGAIFIDKGTVADIVQDLFLLLKSLSDLCHPRLKSEILLFK